MEVCWCQDWASNSPWWCSGRMAYPRQCGDQLGQRSEVHLPCPVGSLGEYMYGWVCFKNSQCLRALQVWSSKIGSRKRWENPRMWITERPCLKLDRRQGRTLQFVLWPQNMCPLSHTYRSEKKKENYSSCSLIQSLNWNLDSPCLHISFFCMIYI